MFIFMSRPGLVLKKSHPLAIGKEVGCAPEPIWTLRRRYEFLTSAWRRTATCRSLISTSFMQLFFIDWAESVLSDQGTSLANICSGFSLESCGLCTQGDGQGGLSSPLFVFPLLTVGSRENLWSSSSTTAT
jgi:hypothetical protein